MSQSCHRPTASAERGDPRRSKLPPPSETTFGETALVHNYPANHFNPHHSLHAAMSFMDNCYTSTGSVEPSLHSSLEVHEELARTYRLIVGGVYRERVALCCRGLVEHRTQFMVMYYALECDRDPVNEWHRFIKAGGKHHFDYLPLEK